MFNYFAFIERYHRDPTDMGDFLDGLDCMSAKSKLEEYWMNKKG